MGHILMIESWVEGNGRILPDRIKKLGHEYTFVTRKLSHYQNSLDNASTHPVVTNAKNVLILETNDTAQLIEELREHHLKDPFDGVITVCDYYLETVSEVAKALSLPQAGSSAVSVERQKHQVREITQAKGLACPDFFVAKTLSDCAEGANKIGYPLIVKPSDLGSSAFVKLVSNEQELMEISSAILENKENFREQLRDPVVLLESVIEGEEFSVESVTFEGKTTFLGITDKSLTGKPHFIEDGHMFPAKLSEGDEKQIITYVDNLLKAVGHNNGVAHTEIKLTENGPTLIEINPRPGGGYIADLVNLVTGIDVLNVLIDLALGKTPDLELTNTGLKSAAIKFYVPTSAGQLSQISGIDEVKRHEACERIKFIEENEQTIEEPIDNACYLGHVIAVDRDGMGARTLAEELMTKVKVVIC